MSVLCIDINHLLCIMYRKMNYGTIDKNQIINVAILKRTILLSINTRDPPGKFIDVYALCLLR